MKWIANVISLCLLWQELRTHFVTKVIIRFHIFDGKYHTNWICSYSYFRFNSCEQFLISLGAGTYTHTDFVNKSIFKKLEVCWLPNCKHLVLFKDTTVKNSASKQSWSCLYLYMFSTWWILVHIVYGVYMCNHYMHMFTITLYIIHIRIHWLSFYQVNNYWVWNRYQ